MHFLKNHYLKKFKKSNIFGIFGVFIVHLISSPNYEIVTSNGANNIVHTACELRSSTLAKINLTRTGSQTFPPPDPFRVY